MKKSNREKNRSVRFRFYKPETEPKKPSQTKKTKPKPKKTGLNRFCSKKPN